jgi:hypothetical protein
VIPHKLKVVHSTREIGPPDPAYAECVCGWTTPHGSLADVAAWFDQHTEFHRAPLSRAPWR